MSDMSTSDISSSDSSSSDMSASDLSSDEESYLPDVVQQKDTRTLAKCLEAAKQRRVSWMSREYIELKNAFHVAASEPDYKDCLALMLQHRDGLFNPNDRTEGETALYAACEAGLEESVLLLLQAGCDPNDGAVTRDEHASYDPDDDQEFETSPLQVAAAGGHSKIVEYLLRFGADVNDDRTECGDVALNRAASEGHLDICRVLLEKGSVVEQSDECSRIPLHYILSAGNLQATRFVWDYMDSDLLNRPDFVDETPFMRAAAHWDAEGVQYLLDRGGRADLYDKDGRAALHRAAGGGCAETVQLLLQRIDVGDYKRFCAGRFKVLFGSTDSLVSLINCPLLRKDSIECLKPLLASELPKSILQMPSVQHIYYCNEFKVYSPIAPLVSVHREPKEFEQLLQLLIKHEIWLQDEFRLEFQIKWPRNVVFVHPFDHLFKLLQAYYRYDTTKEKSAEECIHFFNVLCANGITTDFCLQVYHDTAEAFASFTDYSRYYKTILIAVKFGKVDTVKMLLPNSDILEPDKLLVYSIAQDIPDYLCGPIPEQGSYDMYRYLISLKPTYYRWRQVQQQCESNCGHWSSNYWPYLENDTEDFFGVRLKQLCRTAIREQLRGTSLEDNLRNFRRSILELPLPNSLKDYLLFKS